MRPVGEPSLSYGATWVPDYMMFEPNIDYSSPLRMELFHATNKLLTSESYGQYKDVPYETARDEMKEFLTKNGLTVKLASQSRYLFFMKDLFPEDPVIVAYNAIYANMRTINTIDPSILRHPIILDMIKTYKQILGYFNPMEIEKIKLKEELTELTKGGKKYKEKVCEEY